MPNARRKRNPGSVTWERQPTFIQTYSTSGSTCSDIIWGAWTAKYDCTTGGTAASDTWRIWTDTAATSSNSITIDTAATWRHWVTEQYHVMAQDPVRHTWQTWNENWQPTAAPVVHIPRYRETEEQRRERLRREEEAKQLAAAEAEIRKKANERAEKLLLSVLDDQQRRDWVASGLFYVHVGDRKYQIRRGQHGNISLVDKENRELERFCVLAQGNVPDADNALAQMFMLKHDEAHIIGKANASNVRPGHTSLKQLLREGKPLRLAA